jgi:hypothetical protein
MKAIKIRVVLVAVAIVVGMLVATRAIYLTAEVGAILILGKMNRWQ